MVLFYYALYVGMVYLLGGSVFFISFFFHLHSVDNPYYFILVSGILGSSFRLNNCRIFESLEFMFSISKLV